MSIAVVCPGCKAQFRVSDKFAGKTGPCPKCKAQIQVPEKSPEVKVHAPEEFATGGKDSKGRPATKPIKRKDSKFSAKWAVAIVGGFLATIVLAWLAGKIVENKLLLAGVGAVLVSLPVVVGGYQFLRDQEAEPYRGRELWFRSALCGLIYAGLWGAFWFVPDEWVSQYWSWIYISLPFAAAGITTAFATLDLEPANGFFHYAFYLAVTILLRYVIDLPMAFAPVTG